MKKLLIIGFTALCVLSACSEREKERENLNVSISNIQVCLEAKGIKEEINYKLNNEMINYRNGLKERAIHFFYSKRGFIPELTFISKNETLKPIVLMKLSFSGPIIESDNLNTKIIMSCMTESIMKPKNAKNLLEKIAKSFSSDGLVVSNVDGHEIKLNYQLEKNMIDFIISDQRWFNENQEYEQDIKLKQEQSLAKYNGSYFTEMRDQIANVYQQMIPMQVLVDKAIREGREPILNKVNKSQNSDVAEASEINWVQSGLLSDAQIHTESTKRGKVIDLVSVFGKAASEKLYGVQLVMSRSGDGSWRCEFYYGKNVSAATSQPQECKGRQYEYTPGMRERTEAFTNDAGL